MAYHSLSDAWLTFPFVLQDVAAYRAKGGSGKTDAGKKSGPGRPAAKKAEPEDDDDDDDEDDEDEEEDEDDDEDDD